MRSPFRLLSAILLAMTLQASAARAADCLEAAEVERAEDARYRAQEGGDFATLERLLADDLVYVHATARRDDKGGYLQSMRSGRTRYRQMRRSDTQLRLYGCVGVLTGQAQFEVTVEGRDMTVPLRFTSLWVKRDGLLQFVSWQSSRLP
jgi:ketosteroid isomerase-like protein